VRELEVTDWVFNALIREPADAAGARELVDPLALIAKFDAFSATPARISGAKSAERILAELIVEDRDALGLGPHDGEDLDVATDRIRDRLAKDVSEFLGSGRKPQNLA
jgi:hypothetical protein